uniref:Uncharacterized protein n=1 Tax=Cajanus cajan TaxID=3821 RepID=A0A151TCW8_CAJCA|nr:hypothetical protein KK1_019512 [Cajanus cajan]
MKESGSTKDFTNRLKKIYFKNMRCTIFDTFGSEIMSIKIRYKSFSNKVEEKNHYMLFK